jgi:hypothetical protein
VFIWQIVPWNKFWIGAAELFVFKNSNELVVYFLIYHCEKNQWLCFGWCLYEKGFHQIHTDYEPGSTCQILLFLVATSSKSTFYFSFDTLNKWNINVQHPSFLFWSVLNEVYACYYERNFVVCLKDWGIYLVCCLCEKSDYFLQYVVLINEVGLTLFSLSLYFWLFFEDQ